TDATNDGASSGTVGPNIRTKSSPARTDELASRPSTSPPSGNFRRAPKRPIALDNRVGIRGSPYDQQDTPGVLEVSSTFVDGLTCGPREGVVRDSKVRTGAALVLVEIHGIGGRVVAVVEAKMLAARRIL